MRLSRRRRIFRSLSAHQRLPEPQRRQRAGAAGTQGGVVRLHAGVLRLRSADLPREPAAGERGRPRRGRLSAHDRLLTACGSAHRHDDGDFRRGGESQLGLSHVGADGIPAHRVQRAPRLVARQPALGRREQDAGAGVRALVPAHRAARPDDGAHEVREPVGRRPLRQPRALRARPAALPVDHRLRCRNRIRS